MVTELVEILLQEDMTQLTDVFLLTDLFVHCAKDT